MKKLLILVVFVSIFAQEATHEVKEGDTLWDIAGYYYQNPFLWPYIWRANLANIEDPHWIYPEQQLVIPPSPEQGLAAGFPEEAPAYPPPEVVAPPPPPPDRQATEVISVVTPEPKLFSAELVHRAGIIADEKLPYWGKIIGTEPDESDILAAFIRLVYIDRATDLSEGDILTIYRPGKTIKHPKTGEKLGEETIVLGTARVEAVGSEGSRCLIVDQYDILDVGDFVMPYDDIAPIQPVDLIPTEQEQEGYIVEVKTQHLTTPPHIFVYLDQGEMTGTAPGDLYTIYQTRKVQGKEMPDFDIGKVQIVRVFSKASVGLLLTERETVYIERGERCRLLQEAR